VSPSKNDALTFSHPGMRGTSTPSAMTTAAVLAAAISADRRCRRRMNSWRRVRMFDSVRDQPGWLISGASV